MCACANRARKMPNMNTITYIYVFRNSGIQTFRTPRFRGLSPLQQNTHTHPYLQLLRKTCQMDGKAWLHLSIWTCQCQYIFFMGLMEPPCCHGQLMRMVVYVYFPKPYTRQTYSIQETQQCQINRHWLVWHNPTNLSVIARHFRWTIRSSESGSGGLRPCPMVLLVAPVCSS